MIGSTAWLACSLRRRLFETIPIDRRASRLRLLINPLPCAIGNKAISGESRRGVVHLRIVSGRIQLQHLRGVFAVESLHLLCVALNRMRILAKEGCSRLLVCVPAREQRNVRL